MSRIRDIKRQARRDLHEHLEVAALYLATRDATPVPITVRVHTSFAALGDQKGTNFNSAEMIDRQPQLIFMRNQFIAHNLSGPIRNAIVSVEVGEAYRVGVVRPADDITISSDMVPLTKVEATGLPVPEDA